MGLFASNTSASTIEEKVPIHSKAQTFPSPYDTIEQKDGKTKTEQEEETSTSNPPPRKMRKKPFYYTLLIGLFFPMGLYYISINYLHLSATGAILMSALPPLLDNIYCIWVLRRLDPLSTIPLIPVAVPFLIALFTDDPRILLLKDPLIGYIFAGWMYFSTYFGECNLLWEHKKQFATEARQAKLEKDWEKSYVRDISNFESRVWGVVTFLECTLRVVLIETLPVSVMFYVSQVFPLATLVCLLTWTTYYTRKEEQKYEMDEDVEADLLISKEERESFVTEAVHLYEMEVEALDKDYEASVSRSKEKELELEADTQRPLASIA